MSVNASAPLAPGSILQPPPYQIDQDLPDSTLQMFANKALNDCVMAARAHHTIRLVWLRDRSILSISDQDVINEYYREGRNQDHGLDLGTSLSEWKTTGWPISPALTVWRKIADCSGPFNIQGGRYPAKDPTKVLTPVDLQNRIFTSNGAQINLNLPTTITVNDPNSFGPGHPWQRTSLPGHSLHVILLTGYTADGFTGITWAQRQEIIWEFLQEYCWGVFFAQKSALT